MILRVCTFVFFFLLALISESQTVKKIKELRTPVIRNVSVDRLGNFFLAFDGRITKYNPDGKVMATLKTKNPTLLEPWFHPKIFIYYQAGERLVNYNHNFEVSDEFKLNPSIAIEPLLVCPTNDNKFLVLDAADFSVKKFDVYSNSVMNEFVIDTTRIGAKPAIVFMREYLHFIFLLDKNHGIVVLNELGKVMKIIPHRVENFGFFGEELFYTRPDAIVFWDIYSNHTRELPLTTEKFLLVTDERIIVAREKGVTLYEFHPDKPDDQ